MRRFMVICLTALALIWTSGSTPSASPTEERAPLKLIQTIRMPYIGGHQAELTPDQLAKQVATVRIPTIAGHFDHFEVDLEGHRLFVVPEDNKSVEVLDLLTGKRIHTLRGIGMAHGVLYRPDVREIFVTDGVEGDLKIYRGDDYRLVKTVKLLVDADSIGYDPATQLLYIDNGGKDAGLDYCLLSIVDTNSWEHVGDIKIDTYRVEQMALEKSGPRLFLNATGKNEVAVIDRQKRAVVAKWPVTKGQINASIALDEAHHRMFVACRSGQLVVFDMDTGRELQALPIGSGVDDLVYDPASERIYVACGEGFVNVYQQLDADHYRAIGKVPTGPMGKTGRLVTELNRYYVAVPQHGNTDAEVLVYEVH